MSPVCHMVRIANAYHLQRLLLYMPNTSIQLLLRASSHYVRPRDGDDHIQKHSKASIIMDSPGDMSTLQKMADSVEVILCKYDQPSTRLACKENIAQTC